MEEELGEKHNTHTHTHKNNKNALQEFTASRTRRHEVKFKHDCCFLHESCSLMSSNTLVVDVGGIDLDCREAVCAN